MDKSYYSDYLRDYLLDVGQRVIGLDKSVHENKNALDEFIDARAGMASDEFVRSVQYDLPGGGAQELAMEVLLSGLKELEPTKEEKEMEAQYQNRAKQPNRNSPNNQIEIRQTTKLLLNSSFVS